MGTDCKTEVLSLRNQRCVYVLRHKVRRKEWVQVGLHVEVEETVMRKLLFGGTSALSEARNSLQAYRNSLDLGQRRQGLEQKRLSSLCGNAYHSK